MKKTPLMNKFLFGMALFDIGMSMLTYDIDINLSALFLLSALCMGVSLMIRELLDVK